MKKQAWRSYLSAWMALSVEIAALEGRESECQCDPDNFHRCDLCQELREKAHAANNLMDLWGDTWANELAKRMAEPEPANQ